MDMREVFAERPVLAIMRNVALEDTLDYAGAVVAGGVKILRWRLTRYMDMSRSPCFGRNSGRT